MVSCFGDWTQLGTCAGCLLFELLGFGIADSRTDADFGVTAYSGASANPDAGANRRVHARGTTGGCSYRHSCVPDKDRCTFRDAHCWRRVWRPAGGDGRLAGLC